MPKYIVTSIYIVLLLLVVGILSGVLDLDSLLTKVKTTSEDVQISTNTCRLSRVDLPDGVITTYCIDGYKFVLFNDKAMSRALDDNLKPISCNCKDVR